MNKACQRKIGYTKAEAQHQRHVRLISKGIKGGIYRCSCGKYHLTKRPQLTVPSQIWRKVQNGSTVR